MTETQFHPVATTADVADGDMKAVTIGKKTFALYNLGGSYFATEAFCSHGHALLTEGYIDGNIVECPMHGGTFEIPSGKPVGQPCVTPIATYAVRVEGDTVSIGLNDEP